MLIGSWNINGLRSVSKHGFAEWLGASGIDILCVQEIKIDEASLTNELVQFGEYHSYFNHASKKGYSGVGIFTLRKPNRVTRSVISDERFNSEGRSMLLEFNAFSILNIYMPHGSRDKSNLDYKLRVYDVLVRFLEEYKSQPLIIVGDFNIAHTDIDLARPQQNRKNVMFTEQERQLIDKVARRGFVDSYRYLNPDKVGYTWWPYMANARERNIGWRIDYAFLDQRLLSKLNVASILPTVLGSDHCPITIDIDMAH